MRNWHGNLSPFGRFYSAASALAAYAVFGLKPELVLDFVSGRYFTGYRASPFSEALTHTATSTMTMVDSDGVLKWAPHNFAVTTDGFSAWTTVRAAKSVSSGVLTLTQNAGETNGGGLLFSSPVLTVGSTVTWAVELKDAGQGFARVITNFDAFKETRINLTTGAVESANADHTATVESLGDGWFLVRIEETIEALTNDDIGVYAANAATGALATPEQSILIRKPRLYRSDLGGMVNDYDTGTDYVENTTASPRYRDRRAHYENGQRCLLLEAEAATNINADAIDLSQWLNDWSGGVTATADQAEGPDGNQSLYLLQSIDSTGDGFNDGFSVSAETKYTFSVYVREATSPNFTIRIFDGIGVATIAETTFVWSSGVLGFSSHTTAPDDFNIEDLGGGLYRISYTITTPALCTNINTIIHPSKNGGAVGEGIYAGFIQLEEGSYASSFIPTTGAPATRAAESLSASGVIDSAGGTIVVDVVEVRTDANFGRLYQIDNGVSNDDRRLLFINSGNDDLAFDSADANVVQAGIAAITDYALSPRAFKHGARFGLNDFATSTDGAAAITDTSGTYASGTNDLRLGNSLSGSGARLLLRSLRYWTPANNLTDAGLQEATNPSLTPTLSLDFTSPLGSFTRSETF